MAAKATCLKWPINSQSDLELKMKFRLLNSGWYMKISLFTLSLGLSCRDFLSPLPQNYTLGFASQTTFLAGRNECQAICEKPGYNLLHLSEQTLINPMKIVKTFLWPGGGGNFCQKIAVFFNSTSRVMPANPFKILLENT